MPLQIFSTALKKLITLWNRNNIIARGYIATGNVQIDSEMNMTHQYLLGTPLGGASSKISSISSSLC